MGYWFVCKYVAIFGGGVFRRYFEGYLIYFRLFVFFCGSFIGLIVKEFSGFLNGYGGVMGLVIGY